MRSAQVFTRRPVISRAYLVSLGLHLLLLLLIAFVWRDARYQGNPPEPVISVEFYAPRKPQAVLLRLKMEEPVVSSRGRIYREVSVPAEEVSPSWDPKKLNVTRESQVIRTTDPSVLPGFDHEQPQWDTATDLPSSPSELTETPSGMQGARHADNGGPDRPMLSRSSGAFLDLSDSDGDGDPDLIHPLAQYIDDPNLPLIRMDQVLRTFAESIVEDSGGEPIDVVFVVDYSGSMQDNIEAVQEHFMEMIEVYKRSKLDYALGLVQFRVSKKQSDIRLFHPTRRWQTIRTELTALRAAGDEHALDAIQEGTARSVFRPASRRYFILATDEPFTSSTGWTINDAVSACKEFNITTYVMGLDLPEHHQLADQTGGMWHQIPQRQRQQQSISRRPSAAASSRRNAARYLRSATWKGIERVRQHTLQQIPTNKQDILLVVDISRSMEDKLPLLMEQIEEMFQSWDHALLDYRVGVATFRSGAGSFNYFNIYRPPQQLDAIRKILALRSEGSERVLEAFAESLQRMQWRSDAKRYVILVTDEPSTGKNTPGAVIRMALQQNVTVSVIGTVDDFQQDVAAKTQGLWVPIPQGYTTAQEAW